MKKCSKCGIEKDEIEFSKDIQKKDNLHSWCKKCQHFRHHNYYLKNSKFILEKTKKYQLENPEKIKQLHKKWTINNPEKKKLYAKKTQINHPEYNKKYNIKYPEKIIATRKINYLIKSKKIIKPNFCSICNIYSNRIHGHHPDYSKPEEVIWCCHSCHMKFHNNKELNYA
jgi:hypothetical protein